MADLLSISVESSGLIDMLKHAGWGVRIAAMDAALETAKRIVNEMRARLQRQTQGTGTTAAGINFELMLNNNGYVVLMGDAVSESETRRRLRMGMKRTAKSKLYQVPHTGIYLEFGTSGVTGHDPNPFWFASAALEEGPHLRRLIDAVQRALEESGR